MPLGMTGYGSMYGDPSSFIAGYGVVHGTWAKDAEGKYVYADTSDKMKEPLLALRSMYEEGLIKSDFAVTDILTEEVSNGSCGLFYGPEWFGVCIVALQRNKQ